MHIKDNFTVEKQYTWTYLQNRNRDTDVENKHMDTKEDGGDRMNWESGIYMH